MKRISLALLCVSLLSPLVAEEELTVPRREIDLTVNAVNTTAINGTECTPYYLKSAIDNKPIDFTKVKFVLRSMEWKKELPLVVTPVDSMFGQKIDPESPYEKEMIANGHSHKLWIPTDLKDRGEVQVVGYLSEGSVILAHGEVLQSRGVKQPAPKRY